MAKQATTDSLEASTDLLVVLVIRLMDTVYII